MAKKALIKAEKGLVDKDEILNSANSSDMDNSQEEKITSHYIGR